MTGHKADGLGVVAVRERNAGIGRSTEGCGDSRNDGEWNLVLDEGLEFFTASAEDKRIATLQSTYALAGACVRDQELMNTLLSDMMRSEEHTSELQSLR